MYTYISCMFPLIKLLSKSTLTFLGSIYTFKYWHSMMRMCPLESLSRITCPIYFAHGTHDSSSCIESIDECVHSLQKLGKNVTYKRYEGYGHDFSDNNGNSHKEEVVVHALTWAKRTAIAE